jgi:hypothetical protein
MAAFGTKDPDRNAFAARWKKSIRATSTTQKAIVVDRAIAAFVASLNREGQLEVTYWIARTHWGPRDRHGALSRLLQRLPRVPSTRARRRATSARFVCSRNAALQSAPRADPSRTRAARRLRKSFWNSGKQRRSRPLEAAALDATVRKTRIQACRLHRGTWTAHEKSALHG